MCVLKMDTSVVQYAHKLNTLLNKFLEPGYKLGNDVYLNILLTHLSGKDNQDQGEKLIQLPIFVEWLETAINQWESTLTQPSTSIATFTLNLTSLISVQELNFINLNKTNFYSRLCKILKLRCAENPASVKLGYVKMMHSFTTHKSGLDWLIATDHWNDILQYCLENQTIYIIRDGYSFMYELLSKFCDLNRTFSELIISKIMSRLKMDNILLVVDDVEIQKQFAPTLKLLYYILERAFYAELRPEKNVVVHIFLKVYNLEKVIMDILAIARDPEFIYIVSKPFCLVLFLMNDTETMVPRQTCLFTRRFINLGEIIIKKDSPMSILKVCHLMQIYWQKMQPVLPTVNKTEALIFETQMVIFQIIPLLHIAFNCINTEGIADLKDELVEMYITKLFKISCEQTIRCAYAYRNLISSKSMAYKFNLGQQSLFYLMKSKEYFHRESAVIVFQAMVYAMKYLSKALITKTQVAIDLLTCHSTFFSALLDGLSMLITGFKINWRESVESVCLTSLTLDFLNCPNLPCKLTVQGLHLMHLTIANFMSPNLALLVDNVEGESSVTTITPMLYKRLYDKNWEVRDSALEILKTIVDIGHMKFPAFQKMITDENLCQLAVVLCTDDPEGFVRASAIKNVTAMIKVPEFWENRLEFEQLPEKMLSVLKNETEALVRCEAAKLICEIYEHQYIPSDLMPKVYKTMASILTHDLHWEVKVNALHFWEKVIANELSDQGMIDGAFPSVTFSKEHKKIVKLTESEIQMRLNKALLTLSECGCLGVLITAMQDDCDLQVSKKSVEITNKLTDLLKKYNALNSSMEIAQNRKRPCWDTFSLSSSGSVNSPDSNSTLSDSVIDSIINSTDINLLGSVCQDNMNLSHFDGQVYEMKIIKPDEFKRFVGNDLDSQINDRIGWLDRIDDLGSLLDDILQSYEDTEINSMDCY